MTAPRPWGMGWGHHQGAVSVMRKLYWSIGMRRLVLCDIRGPGLIS